jgi:hypothetical protein
MESFLKNLNSCLALMYSKKNIFFKFEKKHEFRKDMSKTLVDC